VVNLAKYYKIEEDSQSVDGYRIDNYVNKNSNDIKGLLDKNNIEVIMLGTGNKIMGQYPSSGVTLYNGDKIVLLTNNYDKTMIDFIGMSYKDANSILKLMDVSYELDGYGYVYEQNIKSGSKIDKPIILKLKGKY